MPMIVLTTRNIKFSTTSLQVKKLSDIEKESLEGLLKEKECKNSFRSVSHKEKPLCRRPNKRILCVDGLTSEF